MTLVEIAEIAGPILAILGAYGSLRERLGRQDAELKWQSLAIIQMTKKSGSIPPPREKLMTLNDSEKK